MNENEKKVETFRKVEDVISNLIKVRTIYQNGYDTDMRFRTDEVEGLGRQIAQIRAEADKLEKLAGKFGKIA